jgi:hypothetical protein
MCYVTWLEEEPEPKWPNPEFLLKIKVSVYLHYLLSKNISWEI